MSVEKTDKSLTLSNTSMVNTLGASYIDLQNAMKEAIELEDFESAETYNNALNNLKNENVNTARQNLLDTHTKELDRMEKAYNQGKDKFNAIWSERHKKLSKLASAKRYSLAKRCAADLNEFDKTFYYDGDAQKHKLSPHALAYIFVNETNVRYSSVAADIIDVKKNDDSEAKEEKTEDGISIAEKITEYIPTLSRFKASLQLLALRKKMAGCVAIRDFKTALVIRDEVHAMEDVEYRAHVDATLTVVDKVRAQKVLKNEKMSAVLEKRIESAERDLINKWESDLQKLRLHFQTVKTQEDFRYLASTNPKPRSYSNSGSRPASRCSSRSGSASTNRSRRNNETLKSHEVGTNRSMVKSQTYDPNEIQHLPDLEKNENTYEEQNRNSETVEKLSLQEL